MTWSCLIKGQVAILHFKYVIRKKYKISPRCMNPVTCTTISFTTIILKLYTSCTYIRCFTIWLICAVCHFSLAKNDEWTNSGSQIWKIGSWFHHQDRCRIGVGSFCIISAVKEAGLAGCPHNRIRDGNGISTINRQIPIINCLFCFNFRFLFIFFLLNRRLNNCSQY